MSDYLSHSSKLINVEEIRKSLLEVVNANSQKKIGERMDLFEEKWQSLGERISKKEAETESLVAEVVNITDLLAECKEKLSNLDSELNEISIETAVDATGIESAQNQLKVNSVYN